MKFSEESTQWKPSLERSRSMSSASVFKGVKDEKAISNTQHRFAKGILSVAILTPLCHNAWYPKCCGISCNRKKITHTKLFVNKFATLNKIPYLYSIQGNVSVHEGSAWIIDASKQYCLQQLGDFPYNRGACKLLNITHLWQPSASLLKMFIKQIWILVASS